MTQRKIGLIGALAAAALIAFSAVFTYVVAGNSFGTPEKLRLGMQLLDEGRWDLAGRIGRDALADGIDQEQDATWNYLQGVAKLKSVEEDLDVPKNRRVLLDATEHLQRANNLGMPIGYTGKGKFYLGWCQFHTYQWDEAAKQLTHVERSWPEKRSEAFRMLIECQLHKSPADLSAAQAAIETWKAIPGLSADELDRVKIVEAHLAFRQQQPERCEELLKDIVGDSREAYQSTIWRVRWRLAHTARSKRLPAEQRTQLLDEAAEMARALKVDADTPADLRRQAALLSGQLLRQQGKSAEALSTLSGARQSSPHSAEAIAAGIEEVEILVDTGELEGALSTLTYILRNIEDLKLYNEYWIPVVELRARLLNIGRHFRDRDEFEKALSLAELMALAFPRSDSVRLQAEAYEQWATALAAKSQTTSEQLRGEQRELIGQKHLEAAESYATLAQLELRSNEYPDIVWSAITNFQQAGELQLANELLVDYLRHEDRTKRPRGFLALGRNHMDAGQWRLSIDPLERCRIEYPIHPISFEARLLAAKAHYELDQLDQAVELLNENLSGSATSLRPNSDIWRDSLYQLALTTFRQGDERLLELQLDPKIAQDAREEKLKLSGQKFLEVVDLLGGFVTRYPNDHRHFDAMYLIAKSHRLAAESTHQSSLYNPSLVETARRKLMQERRQLLEQALTGYRQLRETIARRVETFMLPEGTSALIRNCYFGEADTLIDLGRLEEAIIAYQNVASLFLHKPESLEALLQMSQCHRKLGQDENAKRILAQAEQVLVRIPPEFDSQFVSLTRTTRAGWSDLLGSLRTLD